MGTVVKYDVSATDGEKNAKEYEQPKPGVYVARIKEVKPGFSKTDGQPDKNKPKLEVIMQITAGQFKGATLTDHIPLSSEAAIFRLDQLLLAVGIVSPKGKRKGQFNTDDLVGEKVRLRVKGETYNGNYVAKVGGIFKLKDEDEDEAESEAEAEEEEPTEDEEPEEDEGEGDGETHAWWEAITQWGEKADEGSEKAIADLTLLAEKAGLSLDDYPDSWASLAEELDTYDWTEEVIDFDTEEEEAEAEDEDEDEEEEEEASMDYASMSIGELRAECRNQGLDDKGTKSDVIDRLTKHASNPFGEDEE